MTIAWTVAGSDSGGGAGIQADLHTFHDFGVHGCSVITATTAQNSTDIIDIHHLPSEHVEAQLKALHTDLPASFIKIGMLGTPQTVYTIADYLGTRKASSPPITVVLDPVLRATCGDSLWDDTNAPSMLIDTLFPLVDIITPNTEEASLLLQKPCNTRDAIEKAAHTLQQYGPSHVIVTGGNTSGNIAADYYCGPTQQFWLTQKRLPTPHTHGSGCSFSAALCAALALGYALTDDALIIAKMYVTQGIATASKLGKGPGPVAHSGLANAPQYLPQLCRMYTRNPIHRAHSATYSRRLLSDSLDGANSAPTPRSRHHDTPPLETALGQSHQPLSHLSACDPKDFPDSRGFASCGPNPLGFYPIVNDISWIAKLLDHGVTTLQLRIKDFDNASTLETIIRTSITLAQSYQARLFINDHWELALQYGAYGVHLGQQDLEHANIDALQQAGLRLGISTHCHQEVLIARTFRPSYIAIGPIYPTTSKSMRFQPQGITKLQYWKKLLPDTPLVAIGGITLKTVAEVAATGVDGIAVISALTQAPNPIDAIALWKQQCP